MLRLFPGQGSEAVLPERLDRHPLLGFSFRDKRPCIRTIRASRGGTRCARNGHALLTAPSKFGESGPNFRLVLEGVGL